MYPQENCVSDAPTGLSGEMAEIAERLQKHVTEKEFRALEERVRFLESLVQRVQDSLTEAMENPMIKQMVKNFGIEL